MVLKVEQGRVLHISEYVYIEGFTTRPDMTFTVTITAYNNFVATTVK